MRRFALLLVLGLLAISPVRAFTPESGFWWIPSEPGSGISLEIQDNFVFLAAYSYDDDGFSTFYTAQGLLTGDNRFVGSITAFDDGACIECTWQPPLVFPDQGQVEILFDAEYLGRLRWRGREVAIERFDFYLSRSGDDFSPFTEMMLGEWQANLDLSSVFSDGALQVQSPYFGEVLVFDLLETDVDGRTFFDGCRPDSTLDLGCSSFALAHHDASGYFDEDLGLHVMVVKDVSGSNAECAVNTFAFYVVEVGTYKFDGDVEFYCQGQNPTGVGDFPVRGYRSASRAAVQTGVGPASAKSAGASAGISSALPAGWSQRASTKVTGSDSERRAAIATELTERILSRSRQPAQ